MEFKKQGDVLKRARLKAGLSQNELGKILGHKSGQSIYHIERGADSVPKKLIQPVCSLANKSGPKHERIDPVDFFFAIILDEKARCLSDKDFSKNTENPI